MKSNILTISQYLTKKEIANKADSIAIKIIESGKGTLQFANKLAAAEYFIKELRANDKLKEAIRVEVDRYGGKHQLSNGARIEAAEVGTKYDYSLCKDKVLNNLLEQQEEINNKVKERMIFLQKIPSTGLVVVDEDTGELVTLYPPFITSTSGYKVILPK